MMATDTEITSGGSGGWGAVSKDCVGLMNIRVWLEEGSSEPLRVQVNLTTDVSAGFERTLALTQAPALVAAVEEWLAEFLRKAKETS